MRAVTVVVLVVAGLLLEVALVMERNDTTSSIGAECRLFVLIYKMLTIHKLVVLNLLVAIQGLNIVGIRLSLDLHEKVGSIPLKKGMSELNFLRRALALVKIVHIQLAHERVEVTVLEICGKSLTREARSIHDFKT